MRELLAALLDCGYRDLDVLSNCEYNFYDLVGRTKEYTEQPNLNDLAYEMFNMAKNDLNDSITERMQELDAKENLTREEAEELNALEQLNPYEDIESWHNFLDTSVYFISNGDVYKKYLDAALDDFEDHTGYRPY